MRFTAKLKITKLGIILISPDSKPFAMRVKYILVVVWVQRQLINFVSSIFFSFLLPLAGRSNIEYDAITVGTITKYIIYIYVYVVLHHFGFEIMNHKKKIEQASLAFHTYRTV
jgi:hypothetical protein